VGAYRRHFVYPLTAAMMSCGLVMLALLIWLTVNSDAQEASRETELAQLVLSNRIDFMRRNQSDYATWDDAVAKLVLSMDSEWASDNIGPYLFHTQGYEHSFVIDGHDRMTYASDGDRQVELDPFALMGPTLRNALAQLRTKPVGEDHRLSGLVAVNGQPAAFSIAAIIPDPGKVKLPRGPASYLLFIDVLTPAQLAGLGGERRLTDLRFLAATQAPLKDMGVVKLWSFDGTPLGSMTWRLDQPGTTLRHACLPVLLAIIALMGLVSIGILRRCRQAIEQTDAAMRRSLADARDARNALEDLTAARTAAARADAEANQRFRRMALHDGLTNLPNRMHFHEELQRRLNLTDQASMAVIMIDLARFKAVNDTHGHQAGDELLKALAARLTAGLNSREFIARLGGDEFAGIVSYDGLAELNDFLDRTVSVFHASFTLKEASLSVCAHIGVAMVAADWRDVDGLLAKADLAMYRAKSARSVKPCFYDAEMDDAARFQRQLVSDLREAIQRSAFELHYQVQASVETGLIIGYEALVRWRHPTYGLISPATFIPLAEETGEIVPLSIWILRQACFEAALWPNRHPISVNLSAVHLSDPALIETVKEALSSSGLPCKRLCLELTKSAIIKDRRFALEQLRALKNLGIAIALDDFGAGYSSLDVLRSFPFDRIKLNASFVASIEHDEQAVSILRSVAALGTTLRMPVLAEAIEHPAQLAIVRREGCSAIQGYLIGRPSRTLIDPAHVQQAILRDVAAASPLTVAA
jgi:diguanylate cyclase (GGDEF)-like protein